MNIQSLAQISLLFLLFVPIQANGDPDDYKEDAIKAIPCRPDPYTYEELTSIFRPVLLNETAEEFKKYFSLMFNKRSPEPRNSDETIIEGASEPERKKFRAPKHDNEVIIEFFRCLYRKMKNAYEIARKAEELQFDARKKQLEALYLVMFPHKAEIAKFDEALAAKIPHFEFPCPNCLRAELGIKPREKEETDDGGY